MSYSMLLRFPTIVFCRSFVRELLRALPRSNNRALPVQDPRLFLCARRTLVHCMPSRAIDSVLWNQSYSLLLRAALLPLPVLLRILVLSFLLVLRLLPRLRMLFLRILDRLSL